MKEETGFVLFKEKGLVKLITLIALIGSLATLSYIPLDLVRTNSEQSLLFLLRLCSSAVIIMLGIIANIFKQQKSFVRLVPFLMFLSITIFSAFITHVIGAFTTNYLYGFLEVVFCWCVVSTQRPVYVIISSCIFISFFNLIISILNYSFLQSNAIFLLEYNAILLVTTALGILSSIISYRYKAQTYKAQKEAQTERQKAESLLLNILPESIAQRLKNGETIISEHYSNSTILFSDIVGFTEYCNGKSSDDIVALLNTIFSVFDEKVKELGLEKIKTIGDGYMVLADGKSDSSSDIIKIIELGEFMIQYIQKYSEENSIPLAIRVGVHTGEVTAGVIGKTKFSFDVWGDTVNVASRMESNGRAMEIHVTEAVAKKIGNKRTCINRGEISVKGKGLMKTFMISSIS